VGNRIAIPSILIPVKGTGKHHLQESMKECYSVIAWFFAKKSLTKTDQCAGALLRRRNQLLVLHIPSDPIPTAMKDVNEFLYSQFYNLPHTATSINYTSEFQKLFEATMYY